MFAQDLLVFLLLDESSTNLDAETKALSPKDSAGALAMATLYYMYLGQIMPAEMYEHLQTTITSAITKLELPSTLPP